MKRRTMTWMLGVLAILPVPAFAQVAVDQTTLSFRSLKWWASLMPGEAEVKAYSGLAAFVLVVHFLQLPLVVRFRASVPGQARRRLLLAVAFTEMVPLIWAVSNSNAAVLAFGLETHSWSPLGAISVPVVSLLTFLILILPCITKTPVTPLSGGTLIVAVTFFFGPYLPAAIFGCLSGLGWISDAGAEVGLFMCMFGVLPQLAHMWFVLKRPPLGKPPASP